MSEVQVVGPAGTQYYRSRDGKVIHTRTCKRRGKAVPWNYAEKLTPPDVAYMIRNVPWLRSCHYCTPERAS